jgi:hypothetical protein
MTLYAALGKLVDELDMHASHFEAFVASRPTVNSAYSLMVPDECLLEGHISRIWQEWSGFWRTCFFNSCLGTVDGNGVAIAARPEAINPMRVSSSSIRAKQGKLPYWKGLNGALRLEPTWGDTDALATIIPRLLPSNNAQLLAAVSSAHVSAKELQAIRNCASHLNAQTMSDVTAFQTAYSSFPINHPVQALFWVDPASNEYLLIKIVEDLKDAAIAAIS